LRVGVAAEVQFRDELFGERSAGALSQNYDFGMNVVAGLEVRLLFVPFVDAFVIGADAGDDRAVPDIGAGLECSGGGKGRRIFSAGDDAADGVAETMLGTLDGSGAERCGVRAPVGNGLDDSHVAFLTFGGETRVGRSEG